MTAGCTLTDVFACHCSVRLCWNGAFFVRGWLTIRRTFRAFCAEQGKTALLAQWDIERNLPLTPDDVTFGSHKRVWWTCPSGHSWQAMVYTRSEGTGCPVCAGKTGKNMWMKSLRYLFCRGIWIILRIRMKKQDGRIIMDKIKFVTDEGETVEFYVEEQTRVNGTDYLLVTDSMDDEANAYILKDSSEETDPEADYVMVEDDVELKAMSKVFSQMMDDVDIEM